MEKKSKEIEIASHEKIIQGKLSTILPKVDLDTKLLVDQYCPACNSPIICVCTGDIGTLFFECYSVHVCLNIDCKLIEYISGEGSGNLGRRLSFNPQECIICNRELNFVKATG